MTLYLLILFFGTGLLIWRMVFIEARKAKENKRLTEDDVVDRELAELRKKLLAMPLWTRTAILTAIHKGVSEVGLVVAEKGEPSSVNYPIILRQADGTSRTTKPIWG